MVDSAETEEVRVHGTRILIPYFMFSQLRQIEQKLSGTNNAYVRATNILKSISFSIVEWNYFSLWKTNGRKFVNQCNCVKVDWRGEYIWILWCSRGTHAQAILVPYSWMWIYSGVTFYSSCRFSSCFLSSSAWVQSNVSRFIINMISMTLKVLY